MSKRKILCVAISVLALVSVGLTSCTSNESEETPGMSNQREQMGPPQQGGNQVQIDFAAAAETLGVTEDVLEEAMGDPRDGRPDFAAIAKKLGVTEEDLIAALGLPEKPAEK